MADILERKVCHAGERVCLGPSAGRHAHARAAGAALEAPHNMTTALPRGAAHAAV